MQSVCDDVIKHDAVTTLDDFNAKLGNEQIYTDIIGRHSLHETTSNTGFRLVQYATNNNFKVLSTCYPRKDMHKGNWKIPGTEDTNQIDHILVSKIWATYIENIRTYRGANSDSDHFLVGARLKQKIAPITRNRIENRKRCNIDKPDETEVQSHYQQEIQKELKGKPPSNDIEEEWAYIKEAIITSAQNVIGEKQNERNEEWYEQEGREMIKAKRKGRLKCIQRNTRTNQEEYNRK